MFHCSTGDETDHLEHLKKFIPEQMHSVAHMIYNLAYSHAVKVTEQAHDILDEPEYRITEQLKFPVLIQKPHESTRKNRLDNFEWRERAKVVELYRRQKGKRVEAINAK